MKRYCSFIIIILMTVIMYNTGFGIEFSEVHGVCTSSSGRIVTIENSEDGLIFKSASVKNPTKKTILTINVPETATRDSSVQVGKGDEWLIETFTSYIFHMTLSPEGDYLAVETFAEKESSIKPAFIHVYSLNDDYHKVLDLEKTGLEFNHMWFYGESKLLLGGRKVTVLYHLDTDKIESLFPEKSVFPMQYIADKDLLFFMAKMDNTEEVVLFIKTPLLTGERKFVGELKQVTEKSESEMGSGSFSYDMPVITDKDYEWILEEGMENISLSGVFEFYTIYPELFKKLSETYPMCGRFSFILCGNGKYVALYDSFTNTLHMVKRPK